MLRRINAISEKVIKAVESDSISARNKTYF